MIWSNILRKVFKKELSFGMLDCIPMGERGRGRREYLLPSKYDIVSGDNPEFKIGFTKSGKPRVLYGAGDELHLVISTSGGYTRRGCGYIVDGGATTELMVANGADGMAGRIGYWNDYVLKVEKPNTVIHYKFSGGGECHRWIVVEDYKVIFHGNKQELVSWIDTEPEISKENEEKILEDIKED